MFLRQCCDSAIDHFPVSVVRSESRARQAGTAEVEVFDEGCLKGMCFFF